MTRDEILALRAQINARPQPKYRREFGAESVAARRKDHNARQRERKNSKNARKAEAKEAARAKTSIAAREARLIKRVLGFGLKTVTLREW